ncbi:prolyl oligopeptidase family serine peptidase [Pueribacillus sp. YX66]|uniref:prolyl oligopeptidase family serine peptidase n=1 Tax=Pueribacillus sp. YX66 TaxID=3229242 RepID=UPI00358D5268
MIQINHGFSRNIPYLHVVHRDIENETLPVIIFVHGFTSAKEHNLHYAFYLAMRGFRVILPEAFLHGERYANVTDAELELSFWEIVTLTIHELEYFVDDFSTEKLIDVNRIGVVGTSMGGIITLGALTQYDWIKVAASLMGTPAYVSMAKSQINALRKTGQKLPFTEVEEDEMYSNLEKYDLSLKPELLKERPLLFWHSETDDVVPFEPTYKFFLKAKSYYTNKPKNIKFIHDETNGHKVSRKGVLETVRWFEAFL